MAKAEERPFTFVVIGGDPGVGDLFMHVSSKLL